MKLQNVQIDLFLLLFYVLKHISCLFLYRLSTYLNFKLYAHLIIFFTTRPPQTTSWPTNYIE